MDLPNLTLTTCYHHVKELITVDLMTEDGIQTVENAIFEINCVMLSVNKKSNKKEEKTY